MFRVQITGLKSEIIPTSKFWEEIDPLSFVFFVQDGKLNIDIEFEAKYAAVGGKQAPAAQAFSSLETDHYEETQKYVEALDTELQASLKTKEIIE